MWGFLVFRKRGLEEKQWRNYYFVSLYKLLCLICRKSHKVLFTIYIYASVMCFCSYFTSFYTTGQCVYYLFLSFFLTSFADVKNIQGFGNYRFYRIFSKCHISYIESVSIFNHTARQINLDHIADSTKLRIVDLHIYFPSFYFQWR